MSNKEGKLRINEIFYSIQGESTYAGLPCVFVRLTYCNLRCTYCDTEYAFHEGDWRDFDDIIKEVKKYNCKLVEVTGGEPLLQENVYAFMKRLCDDGFDVMLETGGHMDISRVDKRVRRIVDIKCPDSGESEKNYWQNIDFISENDQIKFVVGSEKDYQFACEIILKNGLKEKCPLLVSPVFGKIDLEELAGWILRDDLGVRMQLQMHKYIWQPDKRGV
ncbi:MAG: radical SAM protein [Calditrichaeota bacterium]|nr:MAG: radical SAM protein [Calditrichota bacterium]MBL1207837.1 radical SAM protein [Calditrichota bacterium]NOG47671.1 radical SAM protein [Calditrichota bacterium]